MFGVAGLFQRHSSQESYLLIVRVTARVENGLPVMWNPVILYHEGTVPTQDLLDQAFRELIRGVMEFYRLNPTAFNDVAERLNIGVRRSGSNLDIYLIGPMPPASSQENGSEVSWRPDTPDHVTSIASSPSSSNPFSSPVSPTSLLSALGTLQL